MFGLQELPVLQMSFSYINLIEHWGSGIPRIIGKVKAAGLREPEFIGGEVDLRINIYRGEAETNNARINANVTQYGVNNTEYSTNGVKVELNKEQTQAEKLLQIIEKNPAATQAYYADQLGVSKRTISRMFASLQEKGVLIQNGTKRKSNWTIIK
jgi:predicted HTH transcriptional regulator